MDKRKRKPLPASSLANLAEFPKPVDAPLGEKSKTITFEGWERNRQQLAEVSRSQVIRAAIAFAHANPEEFLATLGTAKEQ
jgi:hypothetical protein